MKKINFENLPSTNTPINATNLNLIQSNVEEVFNGAETMGNVIVGDIKCKNLFNYNNLLSTNVFTYKIQNDELIVTRVATGGGIVYETIKELTIGETYTIKANTNDANISLILYKDAIYGNIYKTFDNATNGIQFIAEQDSYVMALIIGSPYGTTGSTWNFGKIQLEKGSIATKYAPYKKYGYNSVESMGNIIVDDIKCKNMFNKYSYTKGYLVAITGELATNAGYGASDFIPVKAGQNYYQQGTNTYYSVLYDENYNFVSHINSNSFTPSQDGYMRTSFSLTNIDTVQVAIGSKETEYTNYKKYDLNTYEIPVTISNGNTYQNNLLKNAKFVVVNWMPSDGSWSMQTLHIQNGYSLNTYGSYSVGSVFNSTDGTIKYNYSTDGNMNITKILIIK